MAFPWEAPRRRCIHLKYEPWSKKKPNTSRVFFVPRVNTKEQNSRLPKPQDVFEFFLSIYSSLNSSWVQQDDTQLDKEGILLVLNSKESLFGKGWVQLECSLLTFFSLVLSEAIAANQQ